MTASQKIHGIGLRFMAALIALIAALAVFIAWSDRQEQEQQLASLEQMIATGESLSPEEQTVYCALLWELKEIRTDRCDDLISKYRLSTIRTLTDTYQERYAYSPAIEGTVLITSSALVKILLSKRMDNPSEYAQNIALMGAVWDSEALVKQMQFTSKQASGGVVKKYYTAKYGSFNCLIEIKSVSDGGSELSNIVLK